jgi:hypothetical protein
MGWLVFFIGLGLPVAIGWWLLVRRRADAPLSLLGLISLPILVWAAAIGAKIGPCKVGNCVSSTQHDRLVFAIVALALLVVAFGLLAYHQQLAGGSALVLAEVVGAIGVQKIDTTELITLLVIGAAALAYLLLVNARARAESRVPDFPPP